METIIEVLKQLPKRVLFYLLIGSELVSLHKVNMKHGTIMTFNKKRHLYQRQIEFNIRGIILTSVLFWVAMNKLPELISNIAYSILESIELTNNMRLYLDYYYTGMYLSIFIISVIIFGYQIWSFELNLYGYDKHNKKEMFKCYWLVGAVTLIGCLTSFIYIYTQKTILPIFMWSILLIIVMVDILVKILYSIPKHNIYKFKVESINNSCGYVDVKKDIKIECLNTVIDVIDLTEKTLKIQNNDDILIIDNKDKYNTVVYKKDAIKYIWVKQDKLEYKNNKWGLAV